MKDRKLLARAYDRSADSYDDRFRALQRPKYEAALPFLPEVAATCLDAGGGTGLFQEFLRERGHPLAGARWLVLDLSLGMLREGDGLRCAADLSHLPLRPGSFDLAVAFTSILDEPGRQLREIQATLVADGLLVASFLAAEADAALAHPSGLRQIAKAAPAGQDVLLVFRKD